MARVEFADNAVIAAKINAVAEQRPAPGIDPGEAAPGAGVDVHHILMLQRALQNRHIDDEQVLLRILDALPPESRAARLILIAELTADLIGEGRARSRACGHAEDLRQRHQTLRREDPKI